MKKKKKIIYITLVFVLISFLGLSILGNNLKAYSFNELNEGLIYEKEIFTVNQGYDYFSNKIIFSGNGKGLLGRVLIEKEENVYYPFLAYYEDDEIKWYDINYNLENGEYIDGFIHNDKIITISNLNNNVVINEYSLNGNVIKTKSLTYNKTIKARNIFLDGKEIYLTGETNSSNFFSKTTENNEVFVLKLTKDFEILDYSIFGNNGDNILLDSKINNNTIILLMKISPEGYYYYKTNPYIVLTCSKRMELDNYYELNIKNPEKLIVGQNNINIYSFNRITNILSRETIDNDLIKGIKSTYYSLEKGKIITYYDISYDNKNELTILSIQYNDSSNTYSEWIIKNNNDEIKAIFSKKLNNKLYTSCYMNKGFIYMTGNEIASHSLVINFQKLAFIKLLNNNCYVNGIKANNETIENNKQVFGYYDGIMEFNFQDLNIESTGQIYIPLEININNNSTYNQGLRLEFNGYGNLNGVSIESGHVINDVGNYVLEIKGNEDIKYYHFIVKKLVDEENDKNYEKLSYEIINSSNTINKTLEQGKNISNTNSSNNIFKYIILVVAAIIGFSLSLIRRRRKYV